MQLPLPEPGLVLSYGYLWRREHRRGAEEARKTRPCVVILVEPLADDERRVMVAAITHATPAANAVAVEIPQRVAQAIGLDAARQWIVLDEVNRFLWPGFDIRPRDGRARESAYGLLPPRFFQRLRDTMLAAHDAHKLRLVDRD